MELRAGGRDGAGLRTERLLLRQWREADRGAFRVLNADRRVMEFFPSVLGASASDGLADRAETHIERHGWGLWAVEVVDGPSFIGFVGLWPAGLGGNELAPMVEVGWRLAYEAWGHGYATEAARASVRHGFEAVGLDEIVSFTAAINTRSRAVMERIGMHRSVDDDFDHPRIPAGHPLRPHVLYRLRR